MKSSRRERMGFAYINGLRFPITYYRRLRWRTGERWDKIRAIIEEGLEESDEDGGFGLGGVGGAVAVKKLRENRASDQAMDLLAGEHDAVEFETAEDDAVVHGERSFHHQMKAYRISIAVRAWTKFSNLGSGPVPKLECVVSLHSPKTVLEESSRVKPFSKVKKRA